MYGKISLKESNNDGRFESNASPEAEVEVALLASENTQSILRLKLDMRYNNMVGVIPRTSSGLKAISPTKFWE